LGAGGRRISPGDELETSPFDDEDRRAARDRVILLEDLHWFDGASDAFLETAVESVPATRDLWLVTFRPEYQSRWTQRSYYQQLPLQALGPEAIRALLRDQLGEDPSVGALPEAIHARTKGNPFFIEEVVQLLVESGHLTGARGAYRLTTAVEALEVPASVQAVLAARIDRLAEREKQVLQTAAVIGKTGVPGPGGLESPKARSKRARASSVAT
jgi:predicted ATPase